MQNIVSEYAEIASDLSNLESVNAADSIGDIHQENTTANNMTTARTNANIAKHVSTTEQASVPSHTTEYVDTHKPVIADGQTDTDTDTTTDADTMTNADTTADAGTDTSAESLPPKSMYSSRYELITTVGEVEKWVQRIEECKICAFNVCGDLAHPMSADPAGLSFAIADHHACYIALRTSGGTVLHDDVLRPYIARVLENAKIQIVGHDVKRSMNVMANWGVRINNVVHDTMIAAWILDINAHRYTLDVVGRTHLDYHIIPRPKPDKKVGYFSTDLPQACVYAAEDVDLTYMLYVHFDARLQQDSVLYELYMEVEMPLISILSKMELSGIKVDADRLSVLKDDLTCELDAVTNDIFQISGEEFNINSTKMLQRILFTKIGLTPIKKN